MSLEAERVMEALHRFEFPLADSLSRALLEHHPSHYLSHFARANYLWYVIITHAHGEVSTEAFSGHLQRAREDFEHRHPGRFTEKDAMLLFHGVIIHALSLRYDAMEGHGMRVAAAGRQAAGYVRSSLGRETEYQGLYLSAGLYNYMVEAAGERYPLLRLYRLLYPRGDKELGIRQLEYAAGLEHPVWSTEARYFLLRIWLDMEADARRALPHAEWLVARYPGNLIFHYYHYQTLVGAGKSSDRLLEKRGEIDRIARSHGGLTAAQRAHFLGLISE